MRGRTISAHGYVPPAAPPPRHLGVPGDMVLRVALREKDSYPYIYVDPSNVVQIMLPFVGGEGIGTDNTCQAAAEYRRFFNGSTDTAPSCSRVIAIYIRDLEFDIATLARQGGSDLLTQKSNRLAQLQSYRAVVGELQAAPLVFEDSLSRVMQGVRSNLYAMRLAPQYIDSVLNFSNASFTLTRPGYRRHGGNGGEGFSAQLRAMLQTPGLQIQARDPYEAFKASLLAALQDHQAPTDESQLVRLRGSVQQFIQERAGIEGFSCDCGQDGSVLDYNYFEDTLGLDHTDSIADWVNNIISATLPREAFDVLCPSSPFTEIATDVQRRCYDTPSILIQFFLATVNIFCAERLQLNTDFGQVLESNDCLRASLIEGVYRALTQGQDVEDCLIQFISSRREFGLTHDFFNPSRNATIKTLFRVNWTTVKGSPHFDEFLVLLKRQGGFFAPHQGRITCHLAYYCQQVAPQIYTRHREILDSAAEAFRALQLDQVPHKSEIPSGSREINLADLLNSIDRSSLPALVSLFLMRDAKSNCLALESETVRQFIQGLPEELKFELFYLLSNAVDNNAKLRSIVESKASLFGIPAGAVLMRVTQAVARSIYTAVTYQRGVASEQYRELTGYGNVEVPDKLSLAIANLSEEKNSAIELPRSIHFCDYDGYIMLVRPQDVEELKRLHQRFQSKLCFTPQQIRQLAVVVQRINPIFAPDGLTSEALLRSVLAQIQPHPAINIECKRSNEYWADGLTPEAIDRIATYISLGEADPALESVPAVVEAPVVSGPSARRLQLATARRAVAPLAPHVLPIASATAEPPDQATRADMVRYAESRTGIFSSCQTSIGPGQSVPFLQKPAQQLLSGLGCSEDPGFPLSQGPPQGLASTVGTVRFRSFHQGVSRRCHLFVDTNRVHELLASSLMYINTDIITEAEYRQALGRISPQTRERCERAGQASIAWQNLAVGLCHAQKIDLLVEQDIDRDGYAISVPRGGSLVPGGASLILLSAPALNFSYGLARGLDSDQQDAFLLGMYRNLFRAAQDQDCFFITLPSAGLGAFGGVPDLYFNALIQAASENPLLTVMYNPATEPNQNLFRERIEERRLPNVCCVTKDVVFLADEIRKSGFCCAIHNPSDADVVYGSYDVGEYWKNGTGERYLAEEHIAAMSTAPLNSRLLNPEAYSRVDAQGFSLPVVAADFQLASPVRRRVLSNASSSDSARSIDPFDALDRPEDIGEVFVAVADESRYVESSNHGKLTAALVNTSAGALFTTFAVMAACHSSVVLMGGSVLAPLALMWPVTLAVAGTALIGGSAYLGYRLFKAYQQNENKNSNEQVPVCM